MSRVRLAALVWAANSAGCAEQSNEAARCAELEARRSITPAQCGPALDFTPINRYAGALVDVEERENAVALIDGRCTGTLIAASAGPVVVTAGHCVGLGDRALVAFNVEVDPDGDTAVTAGTVIERALDPDYALIQLDVTPAVTPAGLTSVPSDLLAVIQHPRGGPKMIAEGHYDGVCGGVIVYADLDTLVGSSGAGVLTWSGYLLGVHSDGDCDVDGSGTNRGSSAAAIVEASAYLQASDIADR
jgi:Trypsin-like peptidase domain